MRLVRSHPSGGSCDDDLIRCIPRKMALWGLFALAVTCVWCLVKSFSIAYSPASPADVRTLPKKEAGDVQVSPGGSQRNRAGNGPEGAGRQGGGVRIASFILIPKSHSVGPCACAYREPTPGHNPWTSKWAAFSERGGVCLPRCLCGALEGGGPTRDSQIITVQQIPATQSALISAAIKGFLRGGSHKNCSPTSPPPHTHENRATDVHEK